MKWGYAEREAARRRGRDKARELAPRGDEGVLALLIEAALSAALPPAEVPHYRPPSRAAILRRELRAIERGRGAR